jgi:hypothetical protein
MVKRVQFVKSKMARYICPSTQPYLGYSEVHGLYHTQELNGYVSGYSSCLNNAGLVKPLASFKHK